MRIEKDEETGMLKAVPVFNQKKPKDQQTIHEKLGVSLKEKIKAQVRSPAKSTASKSTADQGQSSTSKPLIEDGLTEQEMEFIEKAN